VNHPTRSRGASLCFTPPPPAPRPPPGPLPCKQGGGSVSVVTRGRRRSRRQYPERLRAVRAFAPAGMHPGVCFALDRSRRLRKVRPPDRKGRLPLGW
jgi:hypothetical protein